MIQDKKAQKARARAKLVATSRRKGRKVPVRTAQETANLLARMALTK